MKKAIFLFAAIIGSFIMSNAQKVLDKNKITVGYITDEGVVLDSAYNTVGYFKDDGSILNANYVTIGYIKRDGLVKTSTGQKLGSISPQGLIFNAKKNHIGTISSNGTTLMDSQGMTVATLKNVDQGLGAVSIFFFFKLAGVDYYNDYGSASNSTVSLSKSR